MMEIKGYLESWHGNPFVHSQRLGSPSSSFIEELVAYIASRREVVDFDSHWGIPLSRWMCSSKSRQPWTSTSHRLETVEIPSRPNNSFSSKVCFVFIIANGCIALLISTIRHLAGKEEPDGEGMRCLHSWSHAFHSPMAYFMVPYNFTVPRSN